MPYPVEDLIAAEVSEPVLAAVDLQTAAAHFEDVDNWRTVGGILMGLSFFANLLGLCTSVCGGRMRNECIRWHVLHCSAWNFALVLCNFDFSTASPFHDFTKNYLIKSQSMTLEIPGISAFVASVPFVTINYVVTYIFPKWKKKWILQWGLWLPIYSTLTILPIAFIYDYFKKLDYNTMRVINGPLILWYHFLAVYGAMWSLMLLLLFVLGAFCHLLRRLLRRDDDAVGKAKAVRRFLKLTSLCLYIVLCLTFHLPKNAALSVRFAREVISPSVHRQYTKADVLAILNATTSLPVVDMFTTFLPVTYALIPTVEYVSSVLLIKMYRENFVQMVSCGYAYRDHKPGSVWRIMPRGGPVIPDHAHTMLHNSKENENNAMATDIPVKQ